MSGSHDIGFTVWIQLSLEMLWCVGSYFLSLFVRESLAVNCVYSARGAEKYWCMGVPKYLVAPVWCQQISWNAEDVGKDAFSIPSRMDVVVHIVGFVGEGSGVWGQSDLHSRCVERGEMTVSEQKTAVRRNNMSIHGSSKAVDMKGGFLVEPYFSYLFAFWRIMKPIIRFL